MTNKLIAFFAALTFSANAAYAAAAPDFTAQSADGKTVNLSDYKGKIVVLEWNNPECPFVKKFYNSGAMQKLQKAATAKGVIWLSINSSAEGNQGHADAESAKAYIAEHKASPTAYLLDGDGKIGHAYGAKTTPHMFVIDKEGNLAYSGAIDDKASVNPDDIKGAKNYVTAAIDALTAGKTPDVATTQSYGCAVKY